ADCDQRLRAVRTRAGSHGTSAAPTRRLVAGKACRSVPGARPRPGNDAGRTTARRQDRAVDRAGGRLVTGGNPVGAGPGIYRRQPGPARTAHRDCARGGTGNSAVFMGLDSWDQGSAPGTTCRAPCTVYTRVSTTGRGDNQI